MAYTSDQQIPDSNFKIECEAEGMRFHLTERAGYAFSVHAKAALLLSKELNGEVFWVHNDGIEISTNMGKTVEELCSAYTALLPAGA